MKKGNIKKLTLAFAFLIISFGIELYLASNTDKFYPNLTITPDFILNHTPYLNVLWFADAIVLLAIASFLIFIFSEKKWKEIPFYAMILGIYALLRATLSYINPLGNPAPNPGGLGLPFLPNGGMFPSGHVGTIFLFFLLSKNKSKRWCIYFLGLLITEIIIMILSKGHYTIDIVGAFFIAYTLWKVGEEHFRKKLILK